MTSSDALAYLQAADPVLGGLIDRIGPVELGAWRSRPETPFASLLHILTGQQISTVAADAIFGRTLALFGGEPTPAGVLAADPEALRTAGQSRAKVAAFRALADAVERGDLDLDGLAHADDETVRTRLTAIRGVGPWTADLYLLAVLRRPDVIHSGDVGVRRAIQQAYGLDAAPTPREIEQLAERWRPYRSLAATYLVRSLYG